MFTGTTDFFHRRYWPAWVTLALGLVASGGLGWGLYRQAIELDRQRLQRIAEAIRERLHTKVQTTDLIMRHAQDYFGNQESITESMFREWCRKYGWSVTAPWMHGLALYTNLNTGRWRKVMPSDPATWTDADFSTFVALANQAVIRLDLGFFYSHDKGKLMPTHHARSLRFRASQPARDFQVAIASNTPRTTDRQVVIRNASGQLEYGATLAVPLFEVQRAALRDLIVGSPPRVDEHRFNRNVSRGLILAPIDFVMLESLIWGDEPREVCVEIFAATKPRLDAWLNAADHSPRALDPEFKPYLTVAIPWELYNGRWTLYCYTLPAFDVGSPRYMAYVTFGAGAGLTLLATALLAVALRARSRQEGFTEQIREARDALATAQKERQKLSHDLHDNAVQALYAIQLGLGHTTQKLAAEPENAQKDLSTARKELDAVIAEIRRFILAEERAEQEADLSSVLRAMVERTRVTASAELELHCDPDASGRLTGDQAVQLANIAREALSNSLRHARPQQVQIALRSEPKAVCLEISDDGAGFDPQSQVRGVGLTSMAARAQEMGGTLDIQSAPGRGTRVRVRVPAAPPEFSQPD